MNKKAQLPPFGRFLRELRAQNDETQTETGARLGLSVQRFSRIETGRSVPPKTIEASILKAYNLTDEQKTRLHDAVFEARSQKKIDVTGLTGQELESVLNFVKDLRATH